MRAIPPANVDYAVISIATDRINDLLDALQSANILPRHFPAGGGYEEVELRYDRLDLGLRLRARVVFGAVTFEAIDAPGGPEVRLGAPLNLVDTVLEAFVISSGAILASVPFAVSGKVSVTGALEIRRNEEAVFLALRQVLVTPDDTSEGLPTPWPLIDIGEILTRIADRALRVQLVANARLPERRLPINPKINPTGIPLRPLMLGYVCRDPRMENDWLTGRICLPPGMGSPACNSAPTGHISLFKRLDVYAAAVNAPPPQPLNPAGGTFQIDIGAGLINEALADIGKDWSDANPNPLGPFRFPYAITARYDQANGQPAGQYAFHVQMLARHEIWYPQVITCHGWTELWPGGPEVEYDYPCGVTDGWQEIETTTVDTYVWLTSNGQNQVCVGRDGPTYKGTVNPVGKAYEALVNYLVGLIPYIGPFLSAAMTAVDAVWFVATVVAKFVAKLIDTLVPTNACTPIGAQFASLPLLEDRIALLLSSADFHMSQNGITIAFDGDFERR